MNQRVSAIRTEQWRKIVYECLNRDPKISKRQWCRENDVKIRSLMYWQRKFQMEALDQIEGRDPSLPIRTDPVNVPAFADMTSRLEALHSEQDAVVPEQDTSKLAPELMIQAGPYRIYVNGSIQEDTLEKVMRVIRHA